VEKTGKGYNEVVKAPALPWLIILAYMAGVGSCVLVWRAVDHRRQQTELNQPAIDIHEKTVLSEEEFTRRHAKDEKAVELRRADIKSYDIHLKVSYKILEEKSSGSLITVCGGYESGAKYFIRGLFKHMQGQMRHYVEIYETTDFILKEVRSNVPSGYEGVQRVRVFQLLPKEYLQEWKSLFPQETINNLP
jgi:hypothetical protein